MPSEDILTPTISGNSSYTVILLPLFKIHDNCLSS